MAGDAAFGGEATDTREEIMHATYVALQKYGYAGISISRLAEEAGLSKSSFYHHFDGKHDIMLAFADYMLADFERAMGTESTGDPVEDLYTFLNLILGVYPTERSAPDHVERLGAFLELRSQAINDPEFRQKFTENPDRYVARLTEIIEDGIEQGVFNDVDAERTATFLLTIVDGIIVEATTRTDDRREELWVCLSEYIESHLVRERRDSEIASWRQRPGRLTTGGTENNADPRLTTGSPGGHPFFPSKPLEKDLRDPDETEE
ncbi:TetR/AcrR family transcriptional regulator [Haloarcula onubensis]|uniref:TetR/AcrR family transcriptional regulator n=1 Tax=Haloarcula onubensis TaxID=2950539 RepID=A0ABU2FRD7_9EURY|nr:TetR/AcrR family transcriptional regulator [Halomicroarcula sp. S3CR25-11]MDS0283332.1 TetR/AcrR family transcriptional regulator [Halomicroarcula sp. S3CR25-11]